VNHKFKLIIKTAILFIVGACSGLLYIHYIIIKYCGSGFRAQNYFSYLAILFWLLGLSLIYKFVTDFIFIGSGTLPNLLRCSQQTLLPETKHPTFLTGMLCFNQASMMSFP
jgi:hypothetical protein